MPTKGPSTLVRTSIRLPAIQTKDDVNVVLTLSTFIRSIGIQLENDHSSADSKSVAVGLTDFTEKSILGIKKRFHLGKGCDSS